jgi:toxin ParE1/3/4
VKLIWTQGAADDLEEIVLFIRKDSEAAAQRVASTIFTVIESLPSRGRKRPADDSRELVIPSLPYIVLYQVIGEGIFIKAIRHSARA